MQQTENMRRARPQMPLTASAFLADAFVCYSDTRSERKTSYVSNITLVWMNCSLRSLCVALRFHSGKRGNSCDLGIIPAAILLKRFWEFCGKTLVFVTNAAVRVCPSQSELLTTAEPEGRLLRAKLLRLTPCYVVTQLPRRERKFTSVTQI